MLAPVTGHATDATQRPAIPPFVVAVTDPVVDVAAGVGAAHCPVRARRSIGTVGPDQYQHTASLAASAAPEPLVLAGRRLEPTPVFDTYWRFAAERQKVYLARHAGAPAPWTSDGILAKHRFTNCYRASDRVSQYLIRNVIYGGDQGDAEVVFRVLLFKFFNKIETWELLSAQVGTPELSSFDIDAYDEILTSAMSAGRRLYSAAYVMPSPAFGGTRKHTNHLRLLASMMDGALPEEVTAAPSLQKLYETLLSYPSLGPFLAFQYAIDLNYSAVTNFDEMDFVVAGPGAKDGLRKCFGDASVGIETELIRWVADTQHEHLERLGITFTGLWGRPLQLIDCQNLFCEVDKYARVAHPEVAGHSGRTRIKQRYAPANLATWDDDSPAWFPPKWGINDLAEADHRRRRRNSG